MKKDKILDKLYPAVSLVGIIIIWELVVKLKGLPMYILPAPTDIIQALVKDLPLIMSHTKVTLYEAFVGFGIAIVLAFLLALIMDSFQTIKKMFYPLLVVSQTIPTIAIAPIFIIWFGFGVLPKIIMVVISCFFPIIVSLVDGLDKIDEDYLRLFRTMKASKLQTFHHLKLPMAAVHLVSGIKISATYMMTTAIVAEWLGGDKGIGVYMVRSKNAYALDKVFASIIVIVVVSLIIIHLIELIGNRLISWKNIEGGN